MDKNKVQALEGQSLLDLAVQTSGDATGVASLSRINGLPVTSPLDLKRLIDRGEEIDRRRRQYYEQRKIKPATELTVSLSDGGIFTDEFSDVFQ